MVHIFDQSKRTIGHFEPIKGYLSEMHNTERVKKQWIKGLWSQVTYASAFVHIDKKTMNASIHKHSVFVWINVFMTSTVHNKMTGQYWMTSKKDIHRSVQVDVSANIQTCNKHPVLYVTNANDAEQIW